LDSSIVLHFVACSNRVLTELVFAVWSEDVTQVQGAPLDSSRDCSERLNVFITNVVTLCKVLVAGLFQDFLKVTVVVVTTAVFERCGNQ
jgi:hypothetical protein